MKFIIDIKNFRINIFVYFYVKIGIYNIYF